MRSKVASSVSGFSRGVIRQVARDRALRGIEGKRLTISGLVGLDPKQETRRRKRAEAQEPSAQLEMFLNKEMRRIS